MAADPKKPSKSVKVLKFTQNILAVLVFAAILFSIAGKIFLIMRNINIHGLDINSIWC